MKHSIGTMMGMIVILGIIAAAPILRAAEIHRAVFAADLETVTRLLTENPRLLREVDENGRTPLHWACRGVHIDLVEYIIGKGADANVRDNNGVAPLHSAAARGHGKAVKLLLAAGARIDAETKSRSTALHLAAANGHGAVAVYLLKNGAGLDCRDGNEDTPLLAAAWQAKWKVVDLLSRAISAGMKAALNRRDFDGNTVLHLAGRAGRLEIVKMLISKGADLNIRNTIGQTAYNLAKDGGFKELAAGFIQSGAEGSPRKFPSLSGPYLGQTPPGKTPRLFAKGIVSTRSGMYGTIVFSPGGREAFWKPEGPEMLFMKMENGIWSAPRIVPFRVQDACNAPCFSHDGSRLYFMAKGKDPGKMDDKESIWFVERRARGWSDPRPFDPVINALPMHWQFSLDRVGNVYFNSDGGIHLARRKSGGYLAPRPLPVPINIPHSEKEKYMAGELGPFISPEGDFLIYTKLDVRLPRPSQLFISFRKEEGRWSEPLNLSEKLGNARNDSMARLSPDGRYLFFQSERPGSGASRGLYWVDAKVIEELRR